MLTKSFKDSIKSSIKSYSGIASLQLNGNELRMVKNQTGAYHLFIDSSDKIILTKEQIIFVRPFIIKR